MVKLTQGVQDFSEPEEKTEYTIIDVSPTNEKKTKGFAGITITFNPVKPTPQNEKLSIKTTAWYGTSDTIGSKSKLGCFISGFSEYFESVGNTHQESIDMAQDTNNWLNHNIKIISWRDKKRQIVVTDNS